MTKSAKGYVQLSIDMDANGKNDATGNLIGRQVKK